jgi:hypothetical protein
VALIICLLGAGTGEGEVEGDVETELLASDSGPCGADILGIARTVPKSPAVPAATTTKGTDLSRSLSGATTLADKTRRAAAATSPMLTGRESDLNQKRTTTTATATTNRDAAPMMRPGDSGVSSL